jgi:hypothetical protein
VAATTLKAALASTMQFAARLHEQVAERKGGTYHYGRVDGGLGRRTPWPFKVPGSSSQARSREDRWFELNRNCELTSYQWVPHWMSPTVTEMPRDGDYTLEND